MNIDKVIATLEQGFQSPQTTIQRTAIEDAKMPDYGLRRRMKGVSHHWVWCVSVGEMNQAPQAWFIDHKLTDALKKGLSWRGIQPKVRAPRKTNGAQPSAAHK